MSRHHSVAEIRASLERFHGCVYLSAQELKVSPQAIYKRIHGSPELSELVKTFQGRLVDAAVLQLEVFVRQGNLQAVKYVLSTLGKDRGFTERTEVSTNGHLNIDIGHKTDKELEEALLRNLGFLAAAREGGPLGPDGILPPGFPTPN